MGLGVAELALIIIAIGSTIITVIPFWKIFSKAGFLPGLSLLMMVPVINIILLYYVAFAKWPALKKRD